MLAARDRRPAEGLRGRRGVEGALEPRARFRAKNGEGVHDGKRTRVRTRNLCHLSRVTYSIVARDAETGELGVAVQSRAFSVGGAVPWVEPGVGAVATQ